MAAGDIVIRGAREHNLRDVSLTLPRGRLICLTGVSGSGKSSLAFDTLYAEGQRRYVESLSSYARQFLGQMPKPQVDRIDGLSPSISIQQKTGGRNPRSTVGTITEINDYLRVLFARVGQGHCPNCGRPVAAQTREQIVARILEDLPAGTAFMVLAPVVRGQKGEYKDLFADLTRAGYLRARVNGQVVNLSDDLSLDRQIKHQIEVVIDRLKVGPNAQAAAALRGRLVEAVEQALKLGEGTLIVAAEGRPDLMLSSNYACPSCGIGFDPPSPQLFSFNSPQGMCLACDGLGIRHDFDPELLVPDPSKSVWDGAIAPLGPVKEMGRWRRHLFEGVAANLESDPDGPPKGAMLKGRWRDLDEKWRRAWLYGTGDRLIVHRWKNKSKVWSHAEKWVGVANELLAKYRGASGGPTRAARSVHAEHDLPRMPGYPPQSPRAGRQGRRQDPGRAGRHAHRPGLRVLRRTGGRLSPLPTRHSPLPARPGLANHRRGAAQGDPRAADLPDGRRPALPGARPRGADALRRRGPADPAGQPGRRGAGGRALYPGRAVDRPAPQGQRPAPPDLATARRAGQHGGRRRARRGHDARGRPPGRLRSGAGREGGRGHRAGDDRRPGPIVPELDRGLSLGAEVDRDPRRTQGAGRSIPHDQGGPAQQPQGHRRGVPPGLVRLRDGRLGLGEELAGRRYPPRHAGARPERRDHRARRPRRGSRGSISSTR